MSANFPGFIVSFMLLDEKDLGLFPVIKVQPISLSGFLKVRIGFITVFGFVSSLLILLFNGIVEFTVIKSVVISILSAFTVPVLVLTISFIAKNKVEGMTLLKVMNVTLLLPVAIFFIHSPTEYLLGVFPAFWVYKFIEFEDISYLIAFAGFIYLLCLNYFVYGKIVK